MNSPRKRRKLFTIMLTMVALAAFFMVTTAESCNNDDANDKERNTVKDQQSHYLKTQPVPFYEFSQIRDTLIQIYNKIVPETVNTYSVFYSDTGNIIFSCPSAGYPIPADTQLTNPLQIDYYDNGGVIEQAEPAGVFTSKNTNATWVLCVRKNGEKAPVYSEPKVIAFPFEVTFEGGRLVDTGGTSSIVINK